MQVRKRCLLQQINGQRLVMEAPALPSWSPPLRSWRWAGSLGRTQGLGRGGSAALVHASLGCPWCPWWQQTESRNQRPARLEKPSASQLPDTPKRYFAQLIPVKIQARGKGQIKGVAFLPLMSEKSRERELQEPRAVRNKHRAFALESRMGTSEKNRPSPRAGPGRPRQADPHGLCGLASTAHPKSFLS